MTISSPGIGSNLDVNSIVNQLMSVEQQPLTRLAHKEVAYEAKLSAYGSIQGALSSFQSTMAGLANASKYTSISASVSDSSIASASASSIAAVGNFSLQVDKIAQKQSLVSAAFTDTTSAIGTGTLNIQFGEYSGGSFTQNADKASTSITIDATNNSLVGVRDAINKANAGVTASIINTGGGFKLSLTSNDTGTKNTIKLTVDEGTGTPADNTDTTGLSKLAFDPAAVAGSGKNLTESQAANNAEFWINGVFVSKPTNTATDVIQGVTLTLNKITTAGSPVTVSVNRSTSSLSTAAADFVKSFNDLNITIRQLTGYDSKTKQAGLLQGEFAPNAVLSQIRNSLNGTALGLDGQRFSLSQLGITFQKDSSLTFDAGKLSKTLEANPSIIAGFFASTGLATDANVTFASKTASTAIGKHELNVTQLATQGTVAGALAPQLNITAGSNDTIVATVDNQTVSVKLEAKLYTDATALASEVQSKINGALTASGNSVTATVSGGKIALTSSTYGSGSKVIISGNGADGLLDVGRVSTNGLDVAGTINGNSATGSGQYLTAENGLKVSVGGTTTGDRGYIYVSEGLAERLNTLTGQMLGKNGTLSSAQDSINALIKSNQSRQSDLSRRLTDMEARYRKEFSSLDQLLGKMSSTSSYLTQQLSALASLNK